MRARLHNPARILIAGAILSTSAGIQAAQMPNAPPPKSSVEAPTPKAKPAKTSTLGAPLRITLQDALALARKNSPAYHAAITSESIAREDRTQSRDALLPGVNFNTSGLSTQPNGAGGVKFIANNAPHEYISEGNIHEQIDLALFASYRRAVALAAVAKAQAEVASRGIVVTVMQNYFGVAAAEQKIETARRTAEEGERFLQLTKGLEKAGEVAHSDAIRAELQARDRHRQFLEAQLALLNARLDLAVLLFSDFNDNFELSDDLHAALPLPRREEFEAQAAQENPEIRAALATVRAAGHEVTTARAGYLPSIGIDYWYGIDAEHYATYSPNPPDGRVHNLGSSAMASLTLPLWNWGATQSRVRQAELRRDQAKVELSFTQRKLLAQMRSLYSEAETALDELAGLQRSAELAGESLRLSTLRYKNGEGSVLEVVDAQTTFAAANEGYHNGALRYRVALANLQTLTGVLTAQ